MSGLPPEQSCASARADVRPLSAAERAAVLARFHVAAERPSWAALVKLQWASLRQSPFHNIELLAGRAGWSAPVDVETSIDRFVRGLGGPCHVQATGFLALLRALGYNAHFAAATIGAPGDHLVVIAWIDGEGYVCDVGNGHPYAAPFPLAVPITMQRFGWRFSTAVDSEQLVLQRHLGPDDHKIVYRVDPRPRAFSDFAAVVQHHHTRPDFGPFLTGLRAVRITDGVMLTLRDTLYQRHTEGGCTERRVLRERDARALLEGPFGLGALPIEAALAGLRSAAQPLWPTQPALAPGQSHRPSRILVALSTTDRPASLGRLTHGLVDELERRRYGEWPTERNVELLVVENSTSAANRESDHLVAAELAARGLSVEWVDDGVYGRLIGESRVRQSQAIAGRARRGHADDAWWMIDDDLELGQLRLDDNTVLHTEREIDYFSAIDSYKRDRPEIAVILGGVTGDPPIRPEAVLRVQLFDVLANLEWFASLSPDEPYRLRPIQKGFQLSDYYYDHRRDGGEHLSVPFLWLQRAQRDGLVVDEMAAFLGETPMIVHGRAITRPLLLGTRALPSQEQPGCRRGGNTVFLDRDALLHHPYPTFTVAGVPTRRSDMIGASLLASGGSVRIIEACLPLLHRRVPAPTSLDAQAAALISLIGEFYGVLFARVVMERDFSQPVSLSELATMAKSRAALVIARLRSAARFADRIWARLHQRRGAWWETHPTTQPGIASLQGALSDLFAGSLGGPTPAEREAWFIQVQAELQSPDRVRDLACALDGMEQTRTDPLHRAAAWLTGSPS